MKDSLQEAHEFCNKWLKAWTGNTPDQLIEFYSDDVFYRDPANPKGIQGKAALLAYFQKLLAKNPDWVWSSVEIFPLANEPGFTLKWKAEIPHGKEKLTEFGLDLVCLKNGKIYRNEVFFDAARLRR